MSISKDYCDSQGLWFSKLIIWKWKLGYLNGVVLRWGNFHSNLFIRILFHGDSKMLSWKPCPTKVQTNGLTNIVLLYMIEYENMHDSFICKLMEMWFFSSVIKVRPRIFCFKIKDFVISPTPFFYEQRRF